MATIEAPARRPGARPAAAPGGARPWRLARLRGGAARVVERRAPTLGSTWDSPLSSYYLIGGALLVLLLLGLVMVLSSSTISSIAHEGNAFAVFLDQAQFALIGVPLMLLASRLPVAFYRRIAWPALILALVLQSLIFTPLAASEGGNTNWVIIPGLDRTVQPSEFLKLALAVWLGSVLAAKRDRLSDVREVLFPGAVVALGAIGLVVAGHDVGTALILFALVAGALFAAGVPMWVFGGAGLLAAAAVAALAFSSENRTARILAYLGLGAQDPKGLDWQAQHGLYGLGTGGLSGVGLGASREKWLWLPEAHNDFIFAVIGEEFGLVGGVVVIALFVVLAYSGIRVALGAPDTFGALLATGITGWLCVQAFINIGVVVALIPVTGITLPFLSAGGSSLVFSFAAIGILLSVSRETVVKGTWNDASADRGRRHGRPHLPGFGRGPFAARTARRP
jgi:cell division protein FtsW